MDKKEIIRQCRKELDIRQKEVSYIVGLVQSSYCNWEKGREPIKDEEYKIGKIVEYLNYSLEEKKKELLSEYTRKLKELEVTSNKIKTITNEEV